MMEKYGLQRGVRGLEARHTTTLQYYRALKKKNTEMESGLQKLQEQKIDAEKQLQQVKNEIRTDRLKGATTTVVTNIAESVGSLFGSNKFKQLEKENRQLYQEITYRDEDIGMLQQQIFRPMLRMESLCKSIHAQIKQVIKPNRGFKL